MSAFPYNTASPPPTAGPLPVIERANLNTPYATGGGGGGGGLMSSIQLGDTFVACANDGSEGIVLNAVGNIDLNSQLGINLTCQSTIQIGNAANILTVPDTGSVSITGSLVVPGDLSISSINGAAPSGGGPTVVASTLTAATALNVVNQNDPGQQLRFEGASASTIHMIMVPGIQTGISFDQVAGQVQILNADLQVSSINGAAPGGGGGSVIEVAGVSQVACLSDGTGNILMSTSTDGISNEINIVAQGQLFMSGSSASVSGGAINMTLGEDFVNFNRLVAAPEMSTINLTVSSINGAAPGGGGSASFSTLYSGSSTISCDAAVTTALLNFDTTIGHVYQIQTQMTVQGNGGQEGTLDDDVVQEVVNQLFLNATQGSFISTANAAARDVNIGTSGMWKATQGSQALAISGTFSTQVLLTGVSLLDYGAI